MFKLTWRIVNLKCQNYYILGNTYSFQSNISAIICVGGKRKSKLIMKGALVPFNAFGNISNFHSFCSPLQVPSFLLSSLLSFVPSSPLFPPSFISSSKPPLIFLPTLTTHPSTHAKQPYDITIDRSLPFRN